ncbi:MAG TPA: LytTR family DNA-binding domain-containing protein, partial [Acidobacteriota bacterium]|nr:LytTR family DNA-binding domain-containing protein [Acidobacteriota bacterium]
RIVARRRGRIVLLDPGEDSHLTADHTLVFAWKDGQSYLVPRTLQELDEVLTPLGFRRCHRSALVNLRHVTSVRPAESGNFLLDLDDPDKTSVPLSRRRAREIREEVGF